MAILIGIAGLLAAFLLLQLAAARLGLPDPLRFRWGAAWHALWQGPPARPGLPLPARPPGGGIGGGPAAAATGASGLPWPALREGGAVLLAVAALAWIATGTALWAYNAPPGKRSARAWADWMAWRWPVAAAGLLRRRPDWVQDAWRRHWAALEAAAVPQGTAGIDLRRAAAALDQAFALSEPDAAWRKAETGGRLRRIRIAASPRGVGPLWPDGYIAQVQQAWVQWAQREAATALYHAGIPGRWTLDAWGFLHPEPEEPASTAAAQARQEPEEPGSLRQDGPPLTLLPDAPPGRSGRGEADRAAKLLREALAGFGLGSVAVAVGGVGPTVIRLQLRYPRGVAASRVVQLAPDLVAATEGRLRGLRFSDSGLYAEVVREHRDRVPLRALLADPPRPNPEALWIPVGASVQGQPVWGDLATAPHLLVGGTTGSGKSVFSLGYLTALHFLYAPAALRLALVDPKRVDLAPYFAGSPLLVAPIATEAEAALPLVQRVVAAVDARYRLLEGAGVPHLAAYNRRHPATALPRVVLHVDELYDLRLQAEQAGGKEARKALDEALIRIAQIGRAAGVHLVAATQKPSVSPEAIPSLLRSNIPARLALAVATAGESQIILDGPGAELLAGRGDALWKPVGTPQRVQVAYTEPETARAVADWCRAHEAAPPWEEGQEAAAAAATQQ